MRKKTSLVLLAGLCLARFAAFIFRLHVVPFFTQFASEYGTSYAQTGLLISMFMAGYCLVLLPVGAWTDRWGARRVLVIGCLLYAAGGAAFALAGQWTVLLASRALIGAGAAFIYVPTVKLVAVEFELARRGRILGMAEFAGGLGTLTALSVLPMLTAWISQQAVAMTTGLLGLGAGALVLLAAGRERTAAPAREEVPRVGWASAFSAQPMLLCAITAALLYGWTSFMGWAPTYLQDGQGLSRPHVALIMGIATVLGLGSSYWGGRISDRMGRRLPVLAGGLLMCSLGAAALLLGGSWAGSIPAAVLFGIGAPWALNSSMALSTELLGSERAGVLVSLTALAGIGASGVAGSLDGWIRDTTGSYAGIWIGSAVVVGMAAAASLWIREPRRLSGAKEALSRRNAHGDSGLAKADI